MKNKKSTIIIICLIIFLIIVTFLFLFKPIIKINGSEEVTINLNDEYKDKGATIYNIIKVKNYKLYTKNKINNEKVGNYKIVYSTKFLFFNVEKSRIIHVIDNVAPKITLKGNTEISLCPNTVYKDEGYSVNDNYDKNLDSKVKISRERINDYSFYIKYSIKDSSNNMTTAYRKIIEKDIEKPEIKLNGKDTVYLYVGDKYTEEGYFVKDNCDKQVNVSIINNIDTLKVGVYNVDYIATDSAGNKNVISRKVYVLRKNTAMADGVPGVIYLTFDDGPNDKYTEEILNILKEENVKATFFVTMKGSDALIKREFDEGHTVALHTASHQYNYVYSSVDNYFKDLNMVNERVKRITGKYSKIIRFPGGSSNTVSKKYSPGIMTKLTSLVVEKGYHYFDWNISSGDAGDVKTPIGVYNNVTRNLNKQRPNVILMHDINPNSVGALKNMIEYGKRNGYTFDKITYDTQMVTHSVNN